jgi:hypothetical protein
VHPTSIAQTIESQELIATAASKGNTMAILSSTIYDLFVGTLGFIVFVFATSMIYSVYFGPLAKFPGPKLAAATLMYEFYYDVILKGQYTWKIRKLHQEYGLSISSHIQCKK